MKRKHYIAIALIALAVRALPLPTLQIVHAQQVGFLNWYNAHDAYMRADFTDANASGLQNIADLKFFLPANQAAIYRIDCDFSFTQATAAADSYGIQFGSSPTNTMLWGTMATNATAFASIAPVNITSGTATAVVTGTPAVATALGAHIGGYIEVPSASADISVQLSVSQGTAANVIVTKRDSGCTWHAIS